MAEIINLQRTIALNASVFTPFAISLRSAVEEVAARNFAVALISDRRMKELNKFFRSKDSMTDVLSFPYEADEFDPNKNNLGDVVISVEQAKRQAEQNGLTLECEIKQLILHGVLHLCGYDHETDNGEMNAREMELRKEFHIEG